MASSEGEASGVEEADQVAPEEQVDDMVTLAAPTESPELIVATPAVPSQPITDHPNPAAISDGPDMQNAGACGMTNAPYLPLARQDKPPYYTPRPFFGNYGMRAQTVCTWVIGLAPIVAPFVSYSMFGPYGGGYIRTPTAWPIVGNFGYAVPVFPTGIFVGTVELGVIWRFCNNLGLMGYGINVATPIVATSPVMIHGQNIPLHVIRSPYLVMLEAPAEMWNAQSEVAFPFAVPELRAQAMPFVNNSADWREGFVCQGPPAQAWEAANIECGPPGHMHQSEFHHQYEGQSYFQPEENLNLVLMEQQCEESGPQTGSEISQEENGLDMSRVIDVALSLLRLQTSANDALPECNASSSLVEGNFNYQQPNHESIDLVNQQHEGNDEETRSSMFGAIGEPIPGRSILEPGGPGYRLGPNQEACYANTSPEFLTHINVLEDCEREKQEDSANASQIMAEVSGVYEASRTTLNYVAESEAPNTSPPFPTGHNGPDFDQEWFQPPYFVLDPPNPESLVASEGHVPPQIRLDHFMQRGGIEEEENVHQQVNGLYEQNELQEQNVLQGGNRLQAQNELHEENTLQNENELETEDELREEYYLHENELQEENKTQEENESQEEEESQEEYESLGDTDSYLTMSTDSLNSAHIEVERL